jgi:hypothetical protein
LTATFRSSFVSRARLHLAHRSFADGPQDLERAELFPCVKAHARGSLYYRGSQFFTRAENRYEVVKEVARLNKKDAQGNRRVRILAIGFPTMFSQDQWGENTGVRFATLSGARLCQQNGIAFVGLSSMRP